MEDRGRWVPTDILLTNQEKVIKAIEGCIAQMRDLSRVVESGDEEALRTRLSAIREMRKEMFP